MTPGCHKTIVWRPLLWVACFVVGTIFAAEEIPLRAISEICALSQEAAARGELVRFQAVVTFQNDFGDCFVQDKAAAMYVSRKNSAPKFSPGQRVEIIGRTSPGGYAPIVMEDSSRVIGTASI